MSDPSSEPIRFTFNSEDQIEPLVIENFSPDAVTGKIEAGIHAIDLAQYGISLQPDLEYEWFLAIVLDEQERSSDFLASATLKYFKPTEALTEALAAVAEKGQEYAIYAQEGFWYDAIDALYKNLAVQPDNRILHQQRAFWLESVDLSEISAYMEK